jgi:hypothetical protein
VKRFLIIFIWILTSTCFFSACQPKKQSQKEIETSHSIQLDSTTIDFDPINYKEDEIIFYNLFSPIEFTYLVNEKSAYYNSLLINPIDNITKYNSSDKYALNTGVYGADLSYLWMYQQSQQALSYRAAIQRLTDELGVPQEFVDFTYKSAEDHAQEFDSLVAIAKNSYATADNYLKQTGRGHSAALILLGGWIETLYIACNLYENPDSQLLNRITLQRYSLNSMYSLLLNYQDNIEVKEYILLLKKMKKIYEKQNIQISPESLVIDTLAKQIKLRNKSMETMTLDEFKEIQLLTNQIRNHIIQ